MIDEVLPEFPAGAFARQDNGDDLTFYAPPRLVTHIDEAAVAALSGRYRELLPSAGAVLDLMSSWSATCRLIAPMPRSSGMG